MAIKDYRLDPFLNVINIKKISGEYHQVPNQSPYTVRLNEVPQKTDPSSLNIKFANGAVLTEVAAQPSQGQYWTEYNTAAHGVADWNTGTLLFNAEKKKKIVYASYNGIGTLVDDRVQDMLELAVTTSTQPERDVRLSGTAVSYDSSESSGGGNLASGYVRVKQHRGLPAGTYTLREVIQHLINRSQTLEFVKGTNYYNCDCDCGDDM